MTAARSNEGMKRLGDNGGRLTCPPGRDPQVLDTSVNAAKVRAMYTNAAYSSGQGGPSKIRVSSPRRTPGTSATLRIASSDPST